MIAVGVLRAMRESGLSVPGDLAIVSFDGSPESEYSAPPLTSVRQPVIEMGTDAVDQLIQHRAQTAAHHSFQVS